MVSYDVGALFTTVPVDKAVQHIRYWERRETGKSYPCSSSASRPPIFCTREITTDKEKVRPLGLQYLQWLPTFTWKALSKSVFLPTPVPLPRFGAKMWMIRLLSFSQLRLNVSLVTLIKWIHASSSLKKLKKRISYPFKCSKAEKSSRATFYIYLVYLACYLPIACVVLAKINGKTAFYFTSTLVHLNSSLNPLIYCWKMRHIRQTVMNILRTIFAIGPH